MAKVSMKYVRMAASAGHDLYDLTFEAAIEELVKDVAKDNGITKTDAKNAILNALIYNRVQEEIKGQIAFLLGNE